MKAGIDLGNCNSSVQINVGQGVIMDLDKAQGVPTLFMHNKETGKNHFGEECQNQAYAFAHREDVVRYIKTKARNEPNKLNTPGTIVSGGESYSIREVIKLYLEHLISRAQESSRQMFSNDTLESLCITAPATSGHKMMLSTEYRNLLIEILSEITGLSEERIHVISEPVAAAIHYFSDTLSNASYKNETILVFDLGGGTLDITVMTREYAGGSYCYREKKIDGDPELGGRDWDEALAEFVLRDKLDLDPSAPGFLNEAEKCEFMEAIVKAKHDLSISNRAMLSFFINNELQGTFITVDEFEKVTEELRNRAMSLTKKVIDSYDGSIDKVILVGGASNMPQIRKAIEDTFPWLEKSNIFLHEPSKAIAKGAAIYLGVGDIPTPVVHVVERTYGWSSMNCNKIPPREMIYNTLMIDTPFPDGSDTVSSDGGSGFKAVYDDQEKVRFTVYESGVRASECEDGHWANFGADQNTCGIEVSIDIPTEYIGKASQYLLYPKLVLNKNGILKLEVYDEGGELLKDGKNE